MKTNTFKPTEPKRFVLAYASTGCGHLLAAEHVARTIRETHPDAEILMLNVLGRNGALVRKIVERSWQHVSITPVLRDLYRIAHRVGLSNGILSSLLDAFISLAIHVALSTTIKSADHYIALHPLAVHCGAQLKRINGCRLSVVATDFVFHNLHCHNLVDDYFVPPEATVLGSRTRAAINQGRVYSHLIPLGVGFSGGIRSCRNYATEPLRIVVAFGATGLRGLENLDLIRALLSHTGVSSSYTLVAGRNQDLLNAFLILRHSIADSHNIEVLGFVDDMAELMMRSHLLIGKAGGLTVTEAMAVGLPFAIIDTLPGQEDYNCAAVLCRGTGIYTRNIEKLRAFIEQLRDPLEWRKWSVGRNSGRYAFSPHEPVVAIGP